MSDMKSNYLKEKRHRSRRKKGSDLRQRQKQLAKDEILHAALELLSHNGYTKTTMQSIADSAGLGIATVFRNFGTKGAILAALVKRDLEEVFDAGWKIILNPKPSLSDTINALLATFLEILNKPCKRVRAPSQLWTAIVTGRPEFDEVVQWGDYCTQMQLYGAILEFQNKYNVELDYDPADMALNLFYIFNGHYTSFLLEKEGDVTKLLKNLNRRIAIVL